MTFEEFVMNELDWTEIDSGIPVNGIDAGSVNELATLKAAYECHMEGDYDAVYATLGGDSDQVAAWGYAYPKPKNY